MDTNGLIFGLRLMSLDDIMIQTENWRKVADYINIGISQQNHKTNELSKLPVSHASSSQYKKNLVSTRVVRCRPRERHST